MEMVICQETPSHGKKIYGNLYNCGTSRPFQKGSDYKILRNLDVCIFISKKELWKNRAPARRSCLLAHDEPFFHFHNSVDDHTHSWCWRFLDPKALNFTEKWRSIHQSVGIFCQSFLLFPFWKRAWLTLDALSQKDAKGLFLTWGRKSSIKLGYKWSPIWVCLKNAGGCSKLQF